MSKRSLVRVAVATAAAVVMGLILGNVQPAQAQGPADIKHLNISLYEIREAKQDVRAIKGGIPDKYRNELLGKLDAAADALKKCITAMGFKAEYLMPDDRPEYPNFQHLRHAIKELKESKEQLKLAKGVPDDLRADSLKLIHECITGCEKALDYVK
jgi:hypothetical protein